MRFCMGVINGGIQLKWTDGIAGSCLNHPAHPPKNHLNDQLWQFWPDFDETWRGSLIYSNYQYFIIQYKVGTGKILSVRNSVVDLYCPDFNSEKSTTSPQQSKHNHSTINRIFRPPSLTLFDPRWPLTTFYTESRLNNSFLFIHFLLIFSKHFIPFPNFLPRSWTLFLPFSVTTS